MARPTASLANQRLARSDESCVERVRRLIDAAESLLAILEEQRDRLRACRRSASSFAR